MKLNQKPRQTAFILGTVGLLIVAGMIMKGRGRSELPSGEVTHGVVPSESSPESAVSEAQPGQEQGAPTAASSMGESVSAPATSGSPSAPIEGGRLPASAAAPPAATPPVAAAPSCESFEFESSSRKLMAYKSHVLKLPDEVAADSSINKNSFCVRVDKVPVAFEWGADHKELRLGLIPRATAHVRVSFCRGKASCAERCVIPKDEFMEALVGSDESSAEGAPSGWVGTDGDGQKKISKNEKELDQELSKLSAALGDDGARGANTQWKSSERVASCEGR